TIRPGVYIGGQLARVFLAPILPLLGNMAYDVISVFEKRENVEKIIKKIDQVGKEKEEKKKREASKKEGKGQWYDRLKEQFTNLLK
ncbi:unnamed protein product, partial [marine sediment metagenome]